MIIEIGNHRLGEALFYSLKQGVETKNPQQKIINSPSPSSSSSPASPYPPVIAVSVWKEIAEVLKPRLFNAAVARHYEGGFFFFFFFFFFPSPF